MTTGRKEKPMGMRIGENVFCIGYLVFALIAGIIFLVRTGSGEGLGSYYGICAAMTLLLGCGDAFHLVPRIIYNFKGEASNTEEQKKRDFRLGLGNLISSITMTIFYLFFFLAVAASHGISGESVIFILLIILAVIRIALCTFPQNHWFDRSVENNWGIYRNIPFVIMGAITVLYLILVYQEWLLAILVTISFVCYMIVVIGAHKKPMLGMMMIPKTICYIWIVALFL